MSSHPGNSPPMSYEQIAARIENLCARGFCYSCRGLATGEMLPGQPIIFEDNRFRVVLDLNPRPRSDHRRLQATSGGLHRANPGGGRQPLYAVGHTCC